MRSIDLNCDLGDSAPGVPGDRERALLRLVTSANVACGIHAGDPTTVAATVRFAAASGVAIGAHPGLPDREGSGRRVTHVTPEDAYALVLYQIGALSALTRGAGCRLSHVKPHGALYNMAARDRALADAIVAATRAFGPSLTLVGPSGSALLRAADAGGLRSASEVFADRTYQADGSLTPRSAENATIEDQDVAVAQALRMVTDGRVRSVDGQDIEVHADTVCLHGDGPHAVSFAEALRRALEASSIHVKAFR